MLSGRRLQVAPTLSIPCWRKRSWSPAPKKSNEFDHKINFKINIVNVMCAGKILYFTPVLVSVCFQMWCCWMSVQSAIWRSMRPEDDDTLSDSVWRQGSRPGYSAAWRWLRSTSSWQAWNSVRRSSSAPSSHLSPEWATRGVLINREIQPFFGSYVVLLLG